MTRWWTECIFAYLAAVFLGVAPAYAQPRMTTHFINVGQADANHDITHGYHAVAIDEKRKKFPVSLWDDSKKSEQQTIEQVWFAGVHSDVGGWYEERGLSDIALIWMMEKAENAGLRIKPDWREKLRPDPTGPLHESREKHWKLWKPVRRTIPDGALVHESVYARIDKLREYRPYAEIPDNAVSVK